jgi:hypothetical protein
VRLTSKYSLTLYELVCARINLEYMWQEEFPWRDFRALMGVPEDKLLRMPDLLRFCVKVAQDEVNGLSDFRVDIRPVRKGGKQRGLVTGFKVSWWRKNAEELKEAFKELNRSNVGRLSRLRSITEASRPQIVFPPLPLPAE